MLDCDLMEALECVHLAYGWKNARKLWIETRGFTTSVDTAMADYPKSGLVSERELMRAVKKLGKFPDRGDDVRHEIDAALRGEEIPNDYDETLESWFGEHGVEAVRDELKRHAEEQRWEDFRNRRDYERIEAEVAKAKTANSRVS